MISLILVSILLAGAVVSVVFSGLFFAHLVLDSIRQNKFQEDLEVVLPTEQVNDGQNESKDVEEIDLDEMLATLEKRAKENEIAKTEEKEDKKEEPTIIPLVLQKEEAKEEQSELNYEERLAKAKEAFEKLKKDYNKNTKSLNKYRRTERKKARNEKLLNKKAAELASLNLSIYDVKDIKDIDPEKKAKQEDLTKHVAELKSAIVEADEYLEANKEKHLQEVKLNTYLEREYRRYEEEIKSLEEFLNKNDD